MPPKGRLGVGWDSPSSRWPRYCCASCHVPPGIYSGLYLISSTVQVFDRAIVDISDKVWRTSILLRPWIGFLRNMALPILRKWLPTSVTERGHRPGPPSNGHQFVFDWTTTGSCNPPFSFHCKLKISQAEKYPDSRKKIVYTLTFFGFKSFRIQSSHFRFRIQNLRIRPLQF